jgi:hypothetical protein
MIRFFRFADCPPSEAQMENSRGGVSPAIDGPSVVPRK